MFKDEVIRLLRSNNSSLLWFGLVLGAIIYYVWDISCKVDEIHAKTVVLTADQVKEK